MKRVKLAGIARRIRPEELDIWIASPKTPSEAGFGDWIQKEKDFISRLHIPTKNLLIFEQDGLFSGKLAFVDEDTSKVVFLAPAIRECPNVGEIATALFESAKAETTARGIPEIIGVVDSHNKHCEILKNSLCDAGFAAKKEKVLYTKTLDKPLTCNEGNNLVFKGINELDDDALREAIRLYPECSDEEFKQKWSTRGKYWKAVFHKDRFIGLSLLEIYDKESTFNVIAVSPEIRGNGLGNCIFVKALNFARATGATRYLDSTDISNVPMIKIFKKNGCKKYVSRTEFVYFTNAAKQK